MCAVVDEALEYLSLLSRMPVEGMNKLGGLDPCLELQQAQEHRFHSVYQEARRRGAEDSKDVALAALTVRSSTRDLTRSVKARNDLREKILSVCGGNEPDQAIVDLSETLDKLKILVQKKLCTTVEQEESRQGYAAELSLRAREAEKDVEELERQLKEERAKTEHDLSYHNEIISKLNAELTDIRQKTDTLRKRLEKDTNTERSTNLQAHDKRRTAYEEELAKLEEKCDLQAQEYTKAEEALRKKKTKLETEVSNMITKYDNEMGAKQTELEDIQAEYDIELTRLAELSEFFNKVDADIANQKEEEAKMEAERARLRGAMDRLGKAAAKIQALCRGVQLRANSKKKG